MREEEKKDKRKIRELFWVLCFFAFVFVFVFCEHITLDEEQEFSE